MTSVTLEGTRHRGCGGRYALGSEEVTVRLSGMQATVTRQYYRCEACGHEQRTIEQRDAAEQSAIDQIREKNGLLQPREIRRLRESLGLTHAQLADLCYGTPRGIVQGWERGRYLQNREADALLRSLTERAVLEARAARAGVELPAPAESPTGGDAPMASDGPAGADAPPTPEAAGDAAADSEVQVDSIHQGA